MNEYDILKFWEKHDKNKNIFKCLSITDFEKQFKFDNQQLINNLSEIITQRPDLNLSYLNVDEDIK